MGEREDELNYVAVSLLSALVFTVILVQFSLINGIFKKNRLI
jgi:hypothetical protein